MWLFVALIAVPIIEIALFIEVGGAIGLWPTIAIVIATAVAGGILLRSQGFAAMNELQRRMAVGEDPSGTLAHGAMILIAGVLMLTPGFFTDTVGFLLLVPAVRAALIKSLAGRISVLSMQAGPMHQGPTERRGQTTVDADYVDVTPDPEQPPRPENRPPQS
ncbi:MAG: FxsA family protein [Pseudomonadota bacterium]